MLSRFAHITFQRTCGHLLKMIKGAEYNSDGGKLGFVGIFIIEVENLWCDLITVQKNNDTLYKQDAWRVFPCSHKRNGLKKIRKMFLQWLSKEVLRFKFFRSSFYYVM